MTLARAKPGGYTDDVDVLPAAELNQIDLNASRGLDGTDGGDYSPANPLRVDDLEMPGTTRLKYESRSITRYVPLTATAESANWVRNWTTGNIGAWRQFATSTDKLVVDLGRVKDGNVLASVAVRWSPAPGHGGEPASMPTAALFRFNETSGSTTQIASTQITWPGSAGAYEVDQDVVLTPSSETPDGDQDLYFVRFEGESGALSLAAGEVLGVKITQTIVDQDELG